MARTYIDLDLHQERIVIGNELASEGVSVRIIPRRHFELLQIERI